MSSGDCPRLAVSRHLKGPSNLVEVRANARRAPSPAMPCHPSPLQFLRCIPNNRHRSPRTMDRRLDSVHARKSGISLSNSEDRCNSDIGYILPSLDCSPRAPNESLKVHGHHCGNQFSNVGMPPGRGGCGERFSGLCAIRALMSSAGFWPNPVSSRLVATDRSKASLTGLAEARHLAERVRAIAPA